MTKKTHFKPVFCSFFAKMTFLSPFCHFLKPFHPIALDTMTNTHFSVLNVILGTYLGLTFTPHFELPARPLTII